ncbi:NAD kinase [Candidatus Desulfarcum epimagneticum]|uniref:NAD kinase n=1 Tax=uncultured Desulfobacteraceae bacterium TaxID=218296 RepID=A0A484HL31_9BACT|nr:NAD kinase [uncultured Desulfobacteraceae bacterium]
MAKRIGLVVKEDLSARKKAAELEARLKAKGVGSVRKKASPQGRRDPRRPKERAPGDLTCVFALGGDGTFLSAVRWIENQEIPVLGVKFGQVGFLAEASEESLFRMADAIIRDGFETKRRMALSVRVIREGREIRRETVLNDIVINKGAIARLAHIRTDIDDHYVTDYRADGLIVSTPTGSTAYSLAAGGPVVHPGVQGIIITPICPFTLTNRPLIIPDSSRILIRLAKKSSDIMLSFDGQSGMKIDERDRILASKSRRPVYMIQTPGQKYFDILKTKLRWSGGAVQP